MLFLQQKKHLVVWGNNGKSLEKKTKKDLFVVNP
jgi:hypothetical protein